MHHARTRYINEDTEKSYNLAVGDQILFINNHATHFGAFALEGATPGVKQKGSIVLAGVPDDGHVLYFDVCHENSFQLKVANSGDANRDFTLNQGEEEYTLEPQSLIIMRSEPFSVTWDTHARADKDVRVTIFVTPMAEKHGAVIYFSTTPLTEALADDEAKRVAGLNFLERFVDKW